MKIDSLLKKKISKKDFLKSLGFILLVLIFSPKNTLSIFEEEKSEFMVDGKKAIEIIDE